MAGRADSISVFLKLYGGRKFAKELAASGTELEAMGLKGAKAMSRFAASGERLKKFGRSWTRNVSLPVAGLGVIAAKMALGFGRQMSLISSQAGGTVGEVEHLKGAVLELAHHSKFGPEELAKSLFFIESAGKRGATAMRLLNANVKLATTGNSDLEHTTFGTVGAMNALGKEGKNFNRIAAIMNATVGHGHMRMEELVAAMGTGLVGASKSFGVSFGGINSALAFFTRLGEPAQQAATRLRQTISHLATSSTTKGAEALESIGLSAERMGARIRKTGTIGPVIKELTEHLKGVSKGRESQILTEAFGGGRFGTQIREATQQVGLFLKTEREIGKSGTVKELNRGFGISKNQGLVKLEEAWSSIKASVTELGESFLPAIVPLFAKVAKFTQKILGGFTSLSPNVQAVTAGFLLLTGPILSGLGYFAGGVGRILVLTNKLAKAGSLFSSTMSRNVMTEQSGLGGAFKASGVTGAFQTAKGFSLSLGPAVALYGVGNILTSALSGDWKEAGFEAGGAIAGGIAGALIPGGGPMTAMLGMGVGSLAGELLSGLFGSSKKLSPLQERIAHTTAQVTAQFKKLGDASKGLVASESRLKMAQQRRVSATKSMKTAQGRLNDIVAKYGPHSRAALLAEARLTGKVNAHRRAVEKLKNAQRLSGLSLSTYKTTAERTEIVLRRQIRALDAQANQLGRSFEKQKQLNPQSKKTGELAAAFQKTTTELNKAEKKQAQLRESALQKGGPKLLGFLKKASLESLQFGHSLRFATEEFGELLNLKKNTGRGFAGSGAGGFFSINPQTGKVEKTGPGGFGHPSFHPHHRKTATKTPRPRVKKLAGNLGGALHVAVESVNTLMLDGKEVANNTTHHVAGAAARA
jgi:TP901 family phage tail tape measure protein